MAYPTTQTSGWPMNGKAFISGFFDELEKVGLGPGIGPTPTQAMTPPPVGGMLKQRKPKPLGITAAPSTVGQAATPAPTPIG